MHNETIALHNIYSPTIPDFLQDYLAAPEIVRLAGISQECGTDYVKIPMFSYKYFVSRLDHSLAVALIIWNFTKDKKQTLAGLFHDISTPVFSHVIDFLKGDHFNQEFTEDATKSIIQSSFSLMNLLSEEGIHIGEVCDYKDYPIADNKSPRLSSDRLEYNLHYKLLKGNWELPEIKKIYDNLTILKNEDNIEELGFTDFDIAEKFTLGVIENGIIFSSNENKLCMQFLADILKLLLDANIISEKDLYILSEEEIIERIHGCNIDKIKDAWNFYENLTEVKTSESPVHDKYCISLDVKKRYINPLIKTSAGIYRISEISEEANERIEYFRNLVLPKYSYVDFMPFANDSTK